MSDVQTKVKYEPNALKDRRNKAQSLQIKIVKPAVQRRIRSDSLGAIEELVQCGICLEKLSDPRMLPCQHTFCLNCLKTHLIAKNLKFSNDAKITVSPEMKRVTCPMCQKDVILEAGFDSLETFPKNLYIDSLLKLLDGKNPTVSPKIVDFRCIKCQTVSKHQEQICQHCMQVFCNICWNEHLNELESNLSILIKQLDESQNRLKHKADNFSDRCEVLNENIKEAFQQKIADLKKAEKNVLRDVTSIKNEGKIAYEMIQDRLQTLKDKINTKVVLKGTMQKVTTYMNLHRETSKLLDEINHYGEARITFDPDTFKLDQYSEGIYNDLEEKASPNPAVLNPFENMDSMASHYKSRSFTPKLVWTKCPRPAGIAIPPWDDSKLYIAATDSHNVLILDKSKFKLLGRLTHQDMLCPCNLAFSNQRKEIFVSDKWKHCIHVFSSDGEYLRNLCLLRVKSPDGIAIGPNEELIICDSGNNRVIFVDSETGDQLSTIGVVDGNKTELNFPTSVAVYGNSIIVADTGNNRVKIFNINGEKIQEFGSFGKNQCQFRSAEVVAVDPLGLIFVGDAGNARIQVFKQDGTLVKIFGSKKGFAWVSGICITRDLDIITADSKTRSLRIF